MLNFVVIRVTIGLQLLCDSGDFLNIYVIYKFDDYQRVKTEIDKINTDFAKDKTNKHSIFMFEPNRTPRLWHRYAAKKLKDSQLVLIFDSLSGDNTVGKHISWEIKKAEKLKKRIVVFKSDLDSQNRSGDVKGYSEKDPRRSRLNTLQFEEAYDFVKKECDWKMDRKLLHKDDRVEPFTDSEKQLLLEQYRIMIETSEKLMERRQNTVNLYTTLCTTMIALIGASFAFSNMFICAGVLWLSGLILMVLCYNWSLSLDSYDLNNKGKFEVINLLERKLPAEIFECEYRYKEQKGMKSFSSREIVLPRIFSVLGALLILIASALFIYLFCEQINIF